MFFHTLLQPDCPKFLEFPPDRNPQQRPGFSWTMSLLSLYAMWLQRGIALGRAIPRSLVCNVTAWGLVIIAGFSCCWLFIVAFLTDEFNFAAILHRFADQMLPLPGGCSEAGREQLVSHTGSKPRGQGVGGCSCHGNCWWHGGEPHQCCRHPPSISHSPRGGRDLQQITPNPGPGGLRTLRMDPGLSPKPLPTSV